MYFTDSHEWIDVQGECGTVGITGHAREELGEVVFVELPKVGDCVEVGEEVCVLESTKAAVDIYSPVAGTITKVNEELAENVGLLNGDPEKRGWLFELKLEDKGQLEKLLDKTAYTQHTQS